MSWSTNFLEIAGRQFPTWTAIAVSPNSVKALCAHTEAESVYVLVVAELCSTTPVKWHWPMRIYDIHTYTHTIWNCSALHASHGNPNPAGGRNKYHQADGHALIILGRQIFQPRGGWSFQETKLTRSNYSNCM